MTGQKDIGVDSASFRSKSSVMQVVAFEGVSEPLAFVASVFKSLCCVCISCNKFVTEFI